MASIDIPARNALFLHVPKTAGFSITRALRAGCPDAVDHPTQPTRPLRGCASSIARRLGARALERRWTFCFVRDPWDWTVSGWIHVTRNRPAYDDPPDFAAFVRGAWTDGLSRNPHPRKFCNARDHVAYHTQITQAGHLALGWRGRPAPLAFFARFERLHADWARICERLGIEATLPHENRSDRVDYTTYFDDDTRAIVARRNEGFIARFGYRFGEDRP